MICFLLVRSETRREMFNFFPRIPCIALVHLASCKMNVALFPECTAKDNVLFNRKQAHILLLKEIIF